MPKVTQLGHVGIFVKDYDRTRAFYRDILGLHITDENPARGMTFLSSRPSAEHHEIALFRERGDGRLLEQVSFHVASLEELRAFHRLFKAQGVTIHETVTHGIALSIYFFDPEGNRLEVYWPTGIDWRQPFKRPVDLDQPDEVLLKAHL
jgi:catechol 2,3-dioxygenase-like lactoylglutathione lyase family enzyme